MTTTTTTQPSTSTSTSTCRESQKQVLIPIATGSDETEVILLATTLQKFGATVVLAAVDEPSHQCGMMGGFLMTADIRIEEAHQYDWDCIVVPGGGE
jgi:putative intracellular protease/amidase